MFPEGFKEAEKPFRPQNTVGVPLAHLSDYCTYTGLFRYPLPMWAHDAQIDVPELENAIAEMVEAGLIDYDPDEHFIRLVGWFHKRSGPDNPNRVDSVIADLCSFDDIESSMFCKAASELAVASIKRSLRWKQDAPGRVQLCIEKAQGHSRLR